MDTQEWDIGDGSTPECFYLWPTEGELVALVDADLIPYRIGHCIAEESLHEALLLVEEGKVSNVLDTPQCQEAINRVDFEINKWVEGSGADAAKLYLTDCPNQLRYDLAYEKGYKSGRVLEKPPFFYEMKEHIRVKHKAVYCTEYEADDGMAIEQFQATEELAELPTEPAKQVFAGTVIVSVDKDLRIIRGWHYNPVTLIKDWVTKIGSLTPVYKEDSNIMKKLDGSGLLFFYSQIITGDAVDTYGGLKGAGMKKAYDSLNGLKTEEDMYYTVLSLYKDKYKERQPIQSFEGRWRDLSPLERMITQGRLAWMQTQPNEIWREAKNKLILRSDPKWRDKK